MRQSCAEVSCVAWSCGRVQNMTALSEHALWLFPARNCLDSPWDVTAFRFAVAVAAGVCPALNTLTKRLGSADGRAGSTRGRRCAKGGRPEERHSGAAEMSIDCSEEQLMTVTKDWEVRLWHIHVVRDVIFATKKTRAQSLAGLDLGHEAYRMILVCVHVRMHCCGFRCV